jgi:hypothetical protein
VTRVFPIEERHLGEIGAFLHANLNRRISPAAWAASLTHRWAESQPNFGVQLRDADKLAGVFCAIYSDQFVDGRLEKFCNPHSWCVLNEYRNSSISLVLQLLKQPGFHFTMFTPNPKVAEIFLGLRFRNLDDRLLFFPNLPSPWPRGKRFLESNPERIPQHLAGALLRDYNEHSGISWLNFVVFGQEGDVCLAAYKPDRWKRMPCARVLHVSDAGAMERHGHLLGHHLLMDRGLLVSRIEGRFLADVPIISYRTRRTQPKLILSRTLADSQVRDLYSELVALDI